MKQTALLILPAALLCLGAAPAPAPKPPVKTPAAKAAPAKSPAKPATAQPAGPFDSQNPQGLEELLGAAGAQVQTNRREEDAIFVTVTSTAANFSLQFAGCSPQGRACQAALFDSMLEGTSPTLAQMNGFNQTSVVCRMYQDKANHPHATYAALLLKSDNRDSARTHLAAWQGCLAEARDFVRDPVAYLANAA